MDNQNNSWKKIELCSIYLDLLGNRLQDIEEAIAEQKSVEAVTELEKSSKDLRYFYKMVFNVAFYSFAQVFSDVQEESNNIIDEYLKKKKDGDIFGGQDETKY
jgi:hypothetical protein